MSEPKSNIDYPHMVNEQLKRINKLQKENELLREFASDAFEFIDDCKVSHNESRYKYKAQNIAVEHRKAIMLLEGEK